jgi:glycosyltransferase involved in cell wall biosynthesis
VQDNNWLHPRGRSRDFRALIKHEAMRIVQLTNDNREIQKKYHLDEPIFGPAPEALLEGFKSLGSAVEVHVVSCLQQMPRRSPTKLADNIFYHPLHVPKIGWLRTGYQGCVRATRRKIREIQPHIVHGQGTERDCAMCAVFSGFPNVLTIHGVMRSIYNVTKQRPLGYYWFAKHLEQIALRATDGLICISPYVQGLLSRDVTRSWLIPNSLRGEFFTSISTHKRLPGIPRFLNVGVVGPRKRQLELVQLLGDLRSKVAFAVTFVGQANSDDPYARSFLHSLQALDSKFGGFVHIEAATNPSILELYDTSDAMIHFASEESYGLTFAEALARNLYLFSSDVGAIRQISEGVSNVQIFDPQNFNGLGFSLKQWMTKGGHLMPRIRTPNAIIESRNHPRVIAALSLGAYREVLAGTRKPRERQSGPSTCETV